ncbi:ribosomal rna small subunit methyltransferase i [Quercus suber]|uniref:Ribosomal rna small subunit methyltransferase i n=1 Tax=Quercus suber TaxID=58331 RepID=A0AAW0LKS0_QUESU|nr:uncharacterized protein LOC112013015 [Quercus suber]POE49842.1 ribosomal rna small subunit methyltransferase i [Quercus suber]
MFLLSYHKFNESQREQVVLKRLKQGEIVALISDAGTPSISDPGMELVRMTYSYGNGRLDDSKTLAELRFQIGDYLDVAILYRSSLHLAYGLGCS